MNADQTRLEYWERFQVSPSTSGRTSLRRRSSASLGLQPRLQCHWDRCDAASLIAAAAARPGPLRLRLAAYCSTNACCQGHWGRGPSGIGFPQAPDARAGGGPARGSALAWGALSVCGLSRPGGGRRPGRTRPGAYTLPLIMMMKTCQ